jgi:hypothetical protein
VRRPEVVREGSWAEDEQRQGHGGDDSGVAR